MVEAAARTPFSGFFFIPSAGCGGHVIRKWALGPFFVFGDMRKVPDNLQSLVTGVVEPLGFELWGVEMLPRQKSGQLLRIYIDAEAGIGVGDCEKVSRQLSAVLDVEDPIAGEYTLEVSSPGMDRMLFEPAQFARYIGSELRIRLRSTVPGRKNFRGRLTAADEQQLQMQVDDESVEVLMDQIDTARVVPEF